MRRAAFLATLALGLPVGLPLSAQSADAICGDTTVNARILGTGPVRAIITQLQGLRVCMAAEGFTDSSALHPNDWPSRSRLLVLETRDTSGLRRMQSSSVLTSWTKNGAALANDSAASAWRAAVVDLAAAQWDAAARYIALSELENEIAAVAEHQAWVLAQIDTIGRKSDSLRVAVGQQGGRAKLEANSRESSTRRINTARAQRARAALARIPRTPENADRIRAAEASVREADTQARQPSSAPVTPGGGADKAREADAALDNLDAIGRIATLKDMLAELDADARIVNLTAALQALEAQPDPAPRILDAAARIKAIVGR